MWINFKAYMLAVDKKLIAECGMASDCLPDYLYYDAFQNGDTPKDCAENALENARESF